MIRPVQRQTVAGNNALSLVFTSPVPLPAVASLNQNPIDSRQFHTQVTILLMANRAKSNIGC